MKNTFNVVLGVLVCLFICQLAFAAPIPITITIDENGNGIGTVSPGFIAADPGPTGRPNALTYLLPFVGLQGDVLLLESGQLISDIVRFNGNGTVIFYSDNFDGNDSLADPPGIANFSLYNNNVSFPELGPEGNNGLTYTPTAGQPGFDQSNPTYVFISDGAIPEPGTILLLATGLGLIAFRAVRRKLG
jgi:hypothetical protein